VCVCVCVCVCVHALTATLYIGRCVQLAAAAVTCFPANSRELVKIIAC